MTEYQYSVASVFPGVPKYQDAESSASPEVPEYVPKDCEVPFSGYKDEGITHNTPEYVRTMDLDVANINKNDKHTRRTIYEEIYSTYFGEVKLFSRSFLN